MRYQLARKKESKGFVTISIHMDELKSVTMFANYNLFCQRYYCWQQLDQSSSIAAPLPMAKTSSFPKTSRKKQRLSDKDSQEMKLRRMMRNRESAARSRARKLAYVKELQNKVFHLEALIKRLARNKEFNLMERHSVPQGGTRSQLRRTNSALF